jgi:hypothetical protein
MSWIQENKFIVALGAGTAVIAGALLYVGSKGSARYQLALEEHQAAVSEVTRFERLPLYPQADHLDGKRKAIADYRESIIELQESFEKFAASESESVSPQELGNRMVALNDQVTSKLRDAGVVVPAAFFSGFEAYTASLANSAATPVLGQQIAMVESIMADLASAAPAELVNFRRERQPEEEGNSFSPAEGDIARAHSFELTFRGSEESARRFISRLADTDERFVVIRTLRISNESKAPPKSSDAQFAAAAGAADAPANPFGGAGGFGGFFLPPDDDEDDEDAAPVIAPAPAPAAAASSGGTRILGQVAGSELVQVFVRFDLLHFLPPAELPEP